MKFIKKWLQNIIIDAIINCDRAPLIVEIKFKDPDIKGIDVTFRECSLVASSTHAALNIFPIREPKD